MLLHEDSAESADEGKALERLGSNATQERLVTPDWITQTKLTRKKGKWTGCMHSSFT
jgi:hypothetical protein